MSVSMGVQTRTGAGVWLLRSPRLASAKACPMAALGWVMCREGTVEPLAVRARQSRCGTGAQGCQKPTAAPGRAAAQGRRVDGRGQRGWALSSSLLVAGSDRLDRTPRGPLWGRGVWDYFCPLACGSQTRRRRWPCGQGMPSIRLPSEPVGLQGKWREGQERETKCTETPPGSWSCRGENHSVMFAILSAFPPPPQRTQYCIRPLQDLLGLWWTSLQTHWPTLIMASHLTFRPDKQLWLN